MWLLIVSIIGFAVGNGLFLYWLLYEYQGLSAVLHDHLALAFIIDALITLGVLAVHFAKRPPGRHRWPVFVVLSLIGGLCFGLPFYWWLNRKSAA